MLLFPIAILMIENDDDRAFMERLYIEHRYLMFRVAYGIVRDPLLAEDMVSEACASLIDHIDILRQINICKLRFYIVSTVRNASLDYVRKRDRQNRAYFLSGDVERFDAPDEEEIDDALIRQSEAEALRLALNKIHKSERELLRMKYYDMLTDAEIAARLQIGAGSVRYYLTKARRSLKRVLEEG